MHHTRSRRRLAAALALAAAASVTACAPEPEPEPLTVSTAGAAYLDAVCPVNAAWDDADLQIDLLRIAVERGDGDTRAYAASMRRVAEVSRDSADRLADEDRAWPADAADAVAAVADTLTADAEQAEKVAELEAKPAVTHQWEGADDVASTSRAARQALGLPDSGEAACAQRNDHGTEGDAA